MRPRAVERVLIELCADEAENRVVHRSDPALLLTRLLPHALRGRERLCGCIVTVLLAEDAGQASEVARRHRQVAHAAPDRKALCEQVGSGVELPLEDRNLPELPQ